MRVKVELANSLQREVDQYCFSSTLVDQMTSLKASLAEGEKHWKKDSEDATEAYRAFKMNQIFFSRIRMTRLML